MLLLRIAKAMEHGAGLGFLVVQEVSMRGLVTSRLLSIGSSP
jgi:hypothetical protein